MRAGSLGCLLLAAAALGACAKPLQKVAEQPALEVSAMAESKPVYFRGATSKVRRGDPVGDYSVGTFCRLVGNVIYDDVLDFADDASLRSTFNDELKGANYTVVGDPDAVFDDPSVAKAEYMVAAVIKAMSVNACFPHAGRGGWLLRGDRRDVKGETVLTVEWQVFDVFDRKIVHKTTTQGYGGTDVAQRGGLYAMATNAFAQAARNLLADKKLHALLTAETETAAAAQATGPKADVRVRPRAPWTDAISGHIDDVRLNVVTVELALGHGSGFFIDDRGYLLTNAHVAQEAKFVRIVLVTGRRIIGEVVASDRARDVALIKSEPIEIEGLPIDAALPNVGDEVYAMGSPLDKAYAGTLTRGIVSAFRDFEGQSYIQADVRIQGGSSGGPLLDAQGNVIGMTVSRQPDQQGSESGINFFIPIGEALRVLGIRLRGETS